MRIGEVDRHPGGLQSAVDVSEFVAPDRSLDVSAPHLIGHMAQAAQSRFCASVDLAAHQRANGRTVTVPHDEMAFPMPRDKLCFGFRVPGSGQRVG